ncbi:MAG: lipoate--protein ligase family protein [Crenarchaeota archaeon]|nr:lipoate--protein ligase family protein [Thermoproteota archaeon]
MARLLFHRAPQSFLLASEEALTRSVGEKRAPITARLNIFDPPAVLVGYSQDVFEEVNVEEARRLGFEIGRRPTGGGAIVMDREATPGWEVWIPRDFPKLPSDVEGMYRFLSAVPIEALRYLGIDARFRPKNDIEVSGRKISGTGLYTDGKGVMYCGTFLLDLDVSKMLRVLRIPIEKISDKAVKEVSRRIVTAREILGRVPPIERVLEALKHGVESALGVELELGDLNDYEKKLVAELEPRYRSEEWIYGFRRCQGFDRVCMYKTRGGLLRIHVKVSSGVLTQVMISGDMFVYPSRAVLDLEAFLKHTPVESIVEEVERFFRESKSVVYGISPRELGELIARCCTQKSG